MEHVVNQIDFINSRVYLPFVWMCLMTAGAQIIFWKDPCPWSIIPSDSFSTNHLNAFNESFEENNTLIVFPNLRSLFQIYDKLFQTKTKNKQSKQFATHWNQRFISEVKFGLLIYWCIWLNAMRAKFGSCYRNNCVFLSNSDFDSNNHGHHCSLKWLLEFIKSLQKKWRATNFAGHLHTNLQWSVCTLDFDVNFTSI